ncbi:unnamed protein product [Nezara viridula]|uniref:HMA domain-containing protein n=1 Tax=Nezara viridula TaxID=85310 RepID=A0A9P0E7Z5_NEZVI|nr:unnamed protein product [Nezara viridula]
MNGGGNVQIRPSKIYKLYTALWCEACYKELKELLDKNAGPNGIIDYNIDFINKRLSVSTPLTLEEVKLMLQKIGRDFSTEDTS